jgi:erythromycin esterase-like protein
MKMKKLLLFCLCFSMIVPLLATPTAGAQPFAPDLGEVGAPRPPAGYPVQPGIWRLHGTDPTLSMDDLEPFGRLVGRAQVVALGETFHTSGGFYEMKHRLFRYLVEKMGFRVFAIESPWAGADLTGRYVQTCEGSPEDSLQGHLGVWQSTELSDLAQWMCEWNRTHPRPADKLHYMGFDIQQPQEDGPNLIAFLQRIGIAEDHPWIEGIRACQGVTVFLPRDQIPPEKHEQCLQALGAVDEHFRRNGKAILRQIPRQEFDVVRLRLAGLRAWEIQSYLIVGDYMVGEDFMVGYSARDEAMANAFFTLRNLRFPRAKTVVWAANGHISRTILPGGARPMGMHLAKALGRNYANFAIAAYQSDLSFLPFFPCGPVERRDNTVEEKMYELGEDYLLVDLAFPGTRTPFLPRGRFYNMGLDHLVPHQTYTGLIYMEHSPGMHPLFRQSCP